MESLEQHVCSSAVVVTVAEAVAVAEAVGSCRCSVADCAGLPAAVPQTRRRQGTLSMTGRSSSGAMWPRMRTSKAVPDEEEGTHRENFLYGSYNVQGFTQVCFHSS